MKNIYFNHTEDFALAVSNKLDELIDIDGFNDIAIIAKYEEARQIIRELLCIGYDIHSIDIHDIELYGYDSEFIISLTNVGDGYEVWCEPMKRESGYISDESTVTYILDNCSSVCIPYCKANIVYEVGIGDDDHEDCESDKCTYCSGYVGADQDEKYVEYSKDINDDMHGFTASKSNGNSCYSMSFYSTEKLSQRDIQSLLQEAGF